MRVWLRDYVKGTRRICSIVGPESIGYYGDTTRFVKRAPMSKTIVIVGFGPGNSTAVAERFGTEGFSTPVNTTCFVHSVEADLYANGRADFPDEGSHDGRHDEPDRPHQDRTDLRPATPPRTQHKKHQERHYRHR